MLLCRVVGNTVATHAHPSLKGCTMLLCQKEEADELGVSDGLLRVEVSTVGEPINVVAGSYYVPLSQPLANLAIAALEPDSPHSYFANGIVSELGKQARVMAVKGVKRAAAP